MKMCFGNRLGFTYSDDLSLSDLFGYVYASFLVEVTDPTVTGGREIGRVTDDAAIAYKSGRVSYPITLPDAIAPDVFVAGAAQREDGTLVTSGGRVLGVTAVGDTLADAIGKAYEKTAQVGFENAFYRKDIGARALAANKD